MKDISYYIEEWYKHKSFSVLYKAFRKSSGISRIVLSRMVASKIAEESFLNDSVVVDEILDNCGLETLWAIAGGTSNPIVKAKCMERLEGYIENEDNIEYEKEKMSKKMIESVFGEIVDEDKLIDREEERVFYYDQFKRR